MNYARLSSLLCATALGAVLAASCASTHDTADVVPSPPGAVQPDAGGKSVDEATACAKVSGAESSALELVLAWGRRIEVRRNFDAETLTRLIRIIEEI